MAKQMWDRRERDLKERQLTNNGLINIAKVTDSHLERAGVSKREFDHIKLLLAVDENLFRPSEFGSFSPHSMIVDMTKYADKKLSKDAKEILYRPPRVKNLYEKYWQLAKVCEGLEKTEHDAEILKDHKVRYPRKSAEEINLIDSIFSNIEKLIEEDKRTY